MHAASVIAINYLAHARVLAASFRRHHPDARLSILIVDHPADGAAIEIAGADVLRPADVGIDRRELDRRGLMFDEQGVISSLRPILLAHLLDRGAEAVLLIDADMLVLAAFDDVWELARDRGVVLSPHARAPLPGRPGRWREEELLRSGTFSGGFLGVGRRARSFLDWISERAARDCVRAPERGLLYTQTWLNLVPALFDHHVLGDAGINAQIHGLDGRDVEWHGAGPTIEEVPLRLYHFAGFDPATPDRLCRYYPAEDQVGLADRPGLRRLCEQYAALLRDAGWPVQSHWPWRSSPSGRVLDAGVRRAYREGVLAAERGEAPDPPDILDPAESEPALAWLDSPPPGTSVSRYLLGLRAERPDLQHAFPEVPGRDEARFLEWAASAAVDVV